MRILLAAALLIPTQAMAEPFPVRKEIAFQLLNAVDAAQTIACTKSTRCHEVNPIFGRKPSVEKIVGIKVATGVIHFAIARFLFKDSPADQDSFEKVSILIQGGIVAANMRIVF